VAFSGFAGIDHLWIQIERRIENVAWFSRWKKNDMRRSDPTKNQKSFIEEVNNWYVHNMICYILHLI
jgi:hypothetical protein